MHVVVIDGWKEETAELVQTLAGALGIMPYEARQRIIGGGPTVVASFADEQRAVELAAKLNQRAISSLVVDASEVRGRAGHLVVRRFELGDRSLRIETVGGKSAEIPFSEIDLLLPGVSTVGYSETKTVVDRKLSIGKTILSGGIPMSKKVERQEVVSTEESRKFLYLYAGDRPSADFSQDGMSYEGFGAAMKFSRELNFAYLISELRRLSPRAVYDDRLLNRAGQVRILGPALSPETHLNLAAEILARTLRRGRAGAEPGRDNF
jgi:hypothetical protein